MIATGNTHSAPYNILLQYVSGSIGLAVSKISVVDIFGMIPFKDQAASQRSVAFAHKAVASAVLVICK